MFYECTFAENCQVLAARSKAKRRHSPSFFTAKKLITATASKLSLISIVPENVHPPQNDVIAPSKAL